MDRSDVGGLTQGEFVLPCIRCGEIGYREVWSDHLTKWERRAAKLLRFHSNAHAKFLKRARDRKHKRWISNGKRMIQLEKGVVANMNKCMHCLLEADHVTICKICNSAAAQGVCMNKRCGE